MTFSVRGAGTVRLKNSCSTVRSCVLLLLAVCVASIASGQAIITGNTIVSFGATPLGTTVSRTLSYQATTTTVVAVSRVVTNGAPNLDYQLGANTCTGTLLPPNTCTITITFNPTAVGERNGAVVVTDSSDTGATTTFLYGVGEGPQFAFAPTDITALNTAPGLNPPTFTASSSVFDGNGNLYFTDIQNGRILERTTTGAISFLASLPVSANSAIAIAPDGTLYVSALGAVYGFLPGSAPLPIVTAGVTLVNPTGLAIDGYAGLFIADSTTGRIARYSLTGSGTAYVTITGLSTPLLNPTGLGIDSNQNLYVADSGNNRIVELNPAVSATMPATIVTIPGFTLSNPSGVTMDAAGTLYVADTGNKRILEMTIQPAGFALIGAQLTTPVAIAINTTDDLVISDNVLGLVLAPRSTPSITFPTPTIVGTLDTADDPISLTVQGTGNLPAQLLIPQTGTDPSISTNAFLFDSGATCPTVSAGASTATLFSIGQVCTYPIDFEPTQLGPNMANLVLQTTNPGGTVASSTATVPLLGNAISGITSFSLVASPDVTTIGVPVSLTLTALEANGATATYYVGTITFTSTDSTGKFLGGTTYTLTAADKGVLSIPAASGIQFNQLGTFTVTATDGTFTVTSNNVKVVDTSSMTLTSSVNPSQINQSTVFTATVTTSGVPATGTVLFFSNGVQIGTGTLVNGVAALSYAFTAGGTYPITATYAGDTNTEAANAGPLSQVVLFTTSSSAFTSSVNPSLVNQSTTLSLTLSSSGPTPTGSVNFYNGGNLLCTATVTNGTASCPTSFATAGSYPLTAVYSGDASNATLTAGPLTQVVVNASSMTLTSSVNPSLVNQSTTFTAAITTGGAAATGSVKFFNGATLLGTGTLVNGIATLTTSFATPGTYPITATYAGDTDTAAANAGPLSQVVLYTTSSSAFTSSVNPSLVNQSTTLSLTLSSSGPVPIGSVKFFNGNTLLCTATVNNGTASCPASFATVGSYPLTAVYSGDASNAPLTAGPLTQTVVNNSSMTLTSSVNPSLVNQSTTFTAAITTGGAAATGSVKFFNGATLLGTGMLVNGIATLTTSFATPGTYPITATYAGDTNTAAANAGPLAQVVLYTTSASSFTSSINPSLVNQSTTLSLTLSSSGPAPTGTVNFYNGSTLLCTATVANGAASCPVSFAVAGSYALTAVYPGDAGNAPLTAGPLTQIVVNTIGITLTSSVNPSLVGQSTTLTGRLAITAGVGPTGTIKFFDGSTLIGTANVTGGAASISVSFSTVGIHPITAVYSGDTNYATATSAVLLQDVTNPVAATGFTSSVNPSLIGQVTVLTLTLSNPAATGTVTFYNGTTPIGTGNVINGVATLTTSFSAVGSFPLTAVYSGDLNNSGVTAALTQVVTSATGFTLTSSVNPSLVNQPTTLTATISPTGTAPSGTINFFDGTTQIGTGTLANGAVSISVPFATVGIHMLTAVYAGDANYVAATTAPYAQDVVDPATISLISSINPSSVGQATNLTATVLFSGPQPTGTVTFYDAGNVIGTGTVANGIVTVSVPFTTVGTHVLTAVYSGDTDTASETSAPYSQVVVSASTITLTSSVNPSLVNQPTTLTVTLGSVSATPSGTVTFYDGTTVIGSQQVSGTTGSISVSFTTVGIHTLTATYTGDANNAAATSAPLAQDVVNADSIALTSSVNPVVVGANTTLAATIAYTGIAPTGTISFFDGSTIIGTVPVANAGGTLQTSFTTTGTHNLTCTYSGDINNAKATCNTLTEIVLNSASMTLTSSANPANVNQSTTFTATIASAGPAPTGTVKFFSGTTLVCTANVAGGVATCATSFPAGGSFAIKAVYSGDNNTPTETATLTETVLNPVVATLTSSANPTTVNSNVTFTATLTGFTTPNPTGTVAFTIDGAPFSTVPLTGTTASITTSFPTLSTHTVACVYSGDSTYSQTPCNALTESVINPTTSVLTATPNPALAGQAVSLHAVVASAGGNVPTGTVTFTDGATALGTATLAAGVANLSISTLTPGPHNLTCTYAGDTADAPSACNTVADSVLNPSTIALTSSVNPSVIQQSVTFTATVTSAGSAVTGTVTFFDGATALGTSTLSSGVATLSFTFPTAGTYPITAVYSGDSTHQTITSTTLAQVVLNLSTVVLTSTVNPILMNNQTVLTAVVSSTGPTPTGTVSVFDGNAPIANLTLVNGTVSFSTSFTYAGTHLLTVFYNGDPVTATSTSPAITETVGDFSIAVAPNTPASSTILPGASASFSLVLTPIFTSALPSAVTFSIQGQGTGTTSVFSPTVVAAGSGTTPVTLTLTAPQLAMLERGPLQPAQRGPGGARILPMALALLALPLAIAGRRKRFLSAFLMLVFAFSLTGCLSNASSGYFGQVPKTYSITVNASSGQLSRSTVVSLTIQ